MFRVISVIAVCAIAVFSAPGCGAAENQTSAAPPATTDDPRAEISFKKAVALFDAGQSEEADQAFARFTETHGHDPLYGAALIYRARIAIAAGSPGNALKFCAVLEKSTADPTTKRRGVLYTGIAAAASGDHERALSVLPPFAGTLADPAENRLLLASLWRSAAARGDLPRAGKWMDDLLAAAPTEDERASVVSALAEMLSAPRTADDLAATAAAVDVRGAVWPKVMGRLVRVRFAAGDIAGAASAMEELDRAGRKTDADLGDIAAMVENGTRVDLAAIGCILPLSGRMRAVGEAALRGVMLGAKELRLPDGRPFSIVVRDSEGNPERAEEAVDELATEIGVAAIVGPVDGVEGERVAKRAAALGVPALLLSPTGESGVRGALRVVPSSAAEVEALVDAAAETGAKRHAILYPDNAYGRALRDLYTASLARFGLVATAQIPYPEGATDFTAFAKRLAGKPVEIVFVPDTAARIALAAPALAAAGAISSVAFGASTRGAGGALAATSAGFSQELVRRAGRYLQGSLFASHFAESSSPSAAAFAARYREEYKGEPPHLAVYGHDAVVLAAHAIAHGAADRAAIAIALRRSFTTFSEAPLVGRFSGFAKDGAPLTLPYVLTLEGDTWRIAE